MEGGTSHAFPMPACCCCLPFPFPLTLTMPAHIEQWWWWTVCSPSMPCLPSFLLGGKGYFIFYPSPCQWETFPSLPLTLPPYPEQWREALMPAACHAYHHLPAPGRGRWQWEWGRCLEEELGALLPACSLPFQFFPPFYHFSYLYTTLACLTPPSLMPPLLVHGKFNIIVLGDGSCWDDAACLAQDWEQLFPRTG